MRLIQKKESWMNLPNPSFIGSNGYFVNSKVEYS